MLHREPVVVEDVLADPRGRPDLHRRESVKSVLIVPLGAQPIGAIGMYWSEPHRPSEEQVAAARALAASAAAALERARLVQEVERRRITEEDLRELSERDPLTGVLNRRAWDQLLAGALRKGTQPLFVALIDLDRFKDYNDRHGHPAGDALLRRAAAAWRSTIRANDVLARYGGEEFAVLLAGCEDEHRARDRRTPAAGHDRRAARLHRRRALGRRRERRAARRARRPRPLRRQARRPRPGRARAVTGSPRRGSHPAAPTRLARRSFRARDEFPAGPQSHL